MRRKTKIIVTTCTCLLTVFLAGVISVSFLLHHDAMSLQTATTSARNQISSIAPDANSAELTYYRVALMQNEQLLTRSASCLVLSSVTALISVMIYFYGLFGYSQLIKAVFYESLTICAAALVIMSGLLDKLDNILYPYHEYIINFAGAPLALMTILAFAAFVNYLLLLIQNPSKPPKDAP